MMKNETVLKTFNLRVPKEMWIFLKRCAAEEETSMTNIIIRCIDSYKRKIDKRDNLSNGDKTYK